MTESPAPAPGASRMWWAVAIVVLVVVGVVIAVVLWGRPGDPGQSGTAATAQPEVTSTPSPGTPAAGVPDTALDVRWPDSGGLRVLFVGDSIMRGAFATGPELAFPSLITEALTAHGPVVPELAGATGLGAAALIDSVASTSDDHDLVVVEAGTNDVPGGYPEGFAGDYATLLDAIIDRNPDAELLCLGSWAERTSAHPFDVAARDACIARGGKYAGIAQYYADELNRSTIDGFHPSNAGHARIAEVALDHLSLRGQPG